MSSNDKSLSCLVAKSPIIHTAVHMVINQDENVKRDSSFNTCRSRGKWVFIFLLEGQQFIQKHDRN